MTHAQRIAETISDLLPETQKFLCDIIRFPSTPGQELEEMEFLCGAFGALNADVEKAQMSNDLLQDPDYCDPVPDLHYDGRFNVRVVRRGTGGGKTVVLNAHADVVPPSEGMDDAWHPRVADGVVFGRGACDAKGQVATVFLALRALDALGVKLKGDVIAHLVVEEENGGNGTLAMVREGVEADACIDLEPTDGKLMTSIRGAVWFRLLLMGTAGHTAHTSSSCNALLMARDAIGVLENYHDELLAASRGIPLFDPIPNPMPLNFGRLEGGTWPATMASRAVLQGVLGLLPNKTKEQVCEEMRQALRASDNEFLAKNFDLSFMYRHDSSVVDPGHELPQGLLKAAGEVGAPLELGGMPASCDAWFYNNQLGIPTVAWGPGSLTVAHSKDERVDMHEIAKAAETLVTFLIEYCGTAK